MTTAQAEIIALQALGWLAGQDDLLGVFLGASGMSEADLRTRAAEPEVLAAVLDFLLMDDAWVMGFCAAHGYPGESLAQARVALPGGANPAWT